MDTGRRESVRAKMFLILWALLFGDLEIFAGQANESWFLDLSRSEHNVEFDLTGFPDVISVFGSVKKKSESILNGVFFLESNLLSGSAEIGLETIETGIRKQDLLMKKKYLETDKWKSAKFMVERVQLPGKFSPANFFVKAVPFDGTLLLHGVRHKVSGSVDVESNANDLKLRFLFDINMPDYGISLPSYFGMTLTGNVQVSATVRGKLQRRPVQNENLP
jgi:polyisoprenoid-binding protein YceI